MHVVEPVVAVHDRPARRVGQRRRQPVAQLVDAGQLAAARALQLLAPAAHLPLEEALRPAEVGQPDRRRVDRVQRRRARRSARRQLAAPARRRAAPVCAAVRQTVAVDLLHHVERRADHLASRTAASVPRHRHGGRRQRGDAPGTRGAMSCAVASTWPSGGRRTTQAARRRRPRRSGWTCRPGSAPRPLSRSPQEPARRRASARSERHARHRRCGSVALTVRVAPSAARSRRAPPGGRRSRPRRAGSGRRRPRPGRARRRSAAAPPVRRPAGTAPRAPRTSSCRVVLPVQAPVQAEDRVVLHQRVVEPRRGHGATGEADHEDAALEGDALAEPV